jgi:hypothetical protein
MGSGQSRKDTYWPFTKRSVFGIHSYSAKFHYQHRIFLYSLVIFGTYQGCEPVSWATLHCTRHLGPVYPPGCQGIPRLSPHREIGALSLVLFWMLTSSRKGHCAVVVSISYVVHDQPLLKSSCCRRATVGLLAVPDIQSTSRAAGIVSVFASMGSMITGVFCLWRHQTNVKQSQSVGPFNFPRPAR